MQKQLTKQALISLLASLLAATAIGQERGAALATVPEYSDEPSGWVRVEVAIFADSNAATLSTETWEHAPTLRYPESRRWLTRYDEIKALMDEWGESVVTVNADGSIDVVPEPVIEAAQENSEPLIDGELAGKTGKQLWGMRASKLAMMRISPWTQYWVLMNLRHSLVLTPALRPK